MPCPYHASANFVTTRGCRGVRLAVNVERKSGGTGLATDDTDATDIHRLPCASVICANRCYLCPPLDLRRKRKVSKKCYLCKKLTKGER